MAALLLAVGHRRGLIRRNRVFRDRNNALEASDDVFKSFYRLPKHLVMVLIEDLRPELEWGTKRSRALPVDIQVLLSLRLLATGSFQSVAAQIHFHMVHQSTVSRTLHRFTNAMCRRTQRYIKFPITQEEIATTKIEFNRAHDFPGVIGCIDGTQIPIRKPCRPDAFNFLNRKSFYALNVQGVCDSNMVFLDVVARWPGSAHDSHIYNNSELRHLHSAVNGLPPSSWLLGDSGYPQEFCLMVPLLHPITPQDEYYNQCHRSTRNVVERAFGVLKMRWQCLGRAGGHLLYSPAKVVQMIGTCCILHNICIVNNVPALQDHHFEILHDDGDLAEAGAVGAVNVRGEAVRAALIATRFNRP